MDAQNRTLLQYASRVNGLQNLAAKSILMMLCLFTLVGKRVERQAFRATIRARSDAAQRRQVTARVHEASLQLGFALSRNHDCALRVDTAERLRPNWYFKNRVRRYYFWQLGQ
jgi:hypothetical protein